MINDSGVLTLDVGIIAEDVEYSSYVVTAEHYVFNLVSALAFDHVNATDVVIHARDPRRWSQETSGGAYVVGRGEVSLVGPGTGALIGQYSLMENADFVIAAAVYPRVWTEPTAAKRCGARVVMGNDVYELGLRSTRISPTEVVHELYGPGSVLTVAEVPEALDLQFSRRGNALELVCGELVITFDVAAVRTTLDIFIADTDAGDRVVVDEVMRKQGDVAGNVRLEEFFTASATYPHTYDVDQHLTSATELRDRPLVHEETLTTIADIVDARTEEIAATGAEEPLGVPDAGWLEIDGKKVIYEGRERRGGVFYFRLRELADPDLFPIAAGSEVKASTRVLTPPTDFAFDGLGHVSLRELPTRDRLWAPVAQVDFHHVQKTFGKLLDLSAEVSNDVYLRRVQGTWHALMEGPSYRNFHTGIQLAMGLPVATLAGTVTALTDSHDTLGRIIKRTATIDGVDHDLDPLLFPHIDWSVAVGEVVAQFQPLTNGVEVWDEISDALWYQRFPGVAAVERFNTFGIFVAIEAINKYASIADATRFALRLKPTYTKLVMRYLLTSGDEDLSSQLEDTVAISHRPHTCEDLSFPEGDAPEDWHQYLRLGSGHKLGQGKKLGGTWQWVSRTLDDYSRQGPWADGETTAGSETFTGGGGYVYVELEADDGAVSADSDIFVNVTSHTFTAADVGKRIVALGGVHRITELIDDHRVRTATTFATDGASLDWRLQSMGFVATDVAKNIFVHGGLFKINTVTDRHEVEVHEPFATSGTELRWELRDYRRLGGGWGLGEIIGCKCPPAPEHEGAETVTSQQIMTIAFAP